MFRTCRAGHNVWQRQQAVRAHLAAASVASSSASSRAPFGLSGQLRPKTNKSTKTPTPNEEQPNRQATNVPEQTENKEGEGRIIFSAIQPTGIPHLGNYLGALREWKRLQDNALPGDKLIFSIVDLHAMTVPRARDDLLRDKNSMLAALLAIGLDPLKCTIYFQSKLTPISELQWILSCTTSTGYLSRMTQWKSKMQLKDDATLEDVKDKRALKHGLFSYPILQAADILIHRATHVPVGEDQRQHLEFARECVTNFNHTYNTQCLVRPETLISPSKRVMSLTDPTKKMSKSDPSNKSRILITSSEAAIRRKISEAVTDGTNRVTYDPVGRPGVANLLGLLSSFDPAGRTPEQLAKEMEEASLGDLKQAVSNAIIEELAGVRELYLEYLNRPQVLRGVEDEGASRARDNASLTMRNVKNAVGLGTVPFSFTKTHRQREGAGVQ